MDGIFNVLKPAGMTSHDVVAQLRRILQTKKIGHGGTLDPDAAGVLPVFAGSATRLLEYALAESKEYLAEFQLGEQRDTGDAGGALVRALPVPEISEEELRATLARFLGKQQQLPPMYSAVKVHGQKLYELARRGIEVERVPREIEIHSLDLRAYDAEAKKFKVAVACSKGTYIRVLGEDIAKALGTCACMSSLLRTRSGHFFLSGAHSLQEIAAAPEACRIAPIAAVAHLPRLELSARQAARITSGVRTTIAGTADGRYALLGPAGEFLGIASSREEKIQAEKILLRYEMPEE